MNIPSTAPAQSSPELTTRSIVVGLIVAFSAASMGGSADPNQIRPMIASVVDGMYVSLYATLLGIATNLWLKINLRLLGNIDG